MREIGRAYVQALDSTARKVEVLRSRSLRGVARTERQRGVFSTMDSPGTVTLRAPSGFWIVQIQATFTADTSPGAEIELTCVVESFGDIPHVITDTLPRTTETVPWTSAVDGIGNPYPTVKTMSAIGWTRQLEEFNLSLILGATYSSGTTWSDGVIVALPY